MAGGWAAGPPDVHISTEYIRKTMRNIRNKKVLSATVASAVLLLGGLTACGEAETSEALVAEAKQYIAKGDSKAAVIQLKNALIKNPSDIEARLALGTLHNENGDSVSAEKEFSKAKELGATADRTSLGLGTALLNQQKFQEVLDVTAAQSASADAGIQALRGDALLGLRRGDEAKTAYERALAAKPGHPGALTGMARHALTQGDIEGANRFVAQAGTANPSDPVVWMFTGGLQRAQGKNLEAITSYQKALKLKPDMYMALVEKAQIEIQERKFDTAKADLAAARKIAPSALPVLYADAVLQFAQANYPAAKELNQKLLKVAPEHLPSVLMAGSIELATGSPQLAEQHLRKYLAAIPDNAHARKLLATVLIQQGQISEASAIIDPMLAENKDDVQLLAIAGEAAMQTRDFDKAEAYFEQASKLQPKTAALRTSLAMSKLAQGDSARAISELEMSTALDNTSPKAGVLLVLTEMRMKRYDKALAAVKALETSQPKEPMVQNLKGGVYLNMKDNANARASFEKALALKPTYYPAAANLAQLAMAEGKPEQAKQLMLKFLENDKKNVQAMNALAELALRAGKPAEVTQWLEKSSSENPEAIGPARSLGLHYLRTGETQKALTLARKYQVANPTSPELMDLMGQAQLANKDMNGALDSYSKLAAALPKSPQARMRLASIRMAMNNPAGAADELKKALAIQPNYVDAQVAQAELAMNGGDAARAVAIAREIQSQRPKEPVGYALEGRLQAQQGKHAAAVAPLERAFALGANTFNMIALHRAKSRAGKAAEADAQLAQWRKAQPQDSALQLYVADTLLAKKQYKQAIAELEAVTRAAPKNALAMNNLAWAYQQDKDARALKTADQAHALAPDNPAVMDTLGWILVEQGNLGRGLPLLKKAVELAPDAADIRFHLAQGLAKSGDKAAARQHLDKVIAAKNFERLDEARAFEKQL